ncbi:adenylate/guanylate cyclase domain-containing protein [Anabaena sp. UHCC 0399]|uniref:adenylate/guanylate cyclase domain-containing protein n=1 Tax=Anabaena sp. UHCC 0399 TaxID=3110238 RepID=UPI002B2111D0|nr:adenylate/guanylate cyclase domain-containing protein [Anabaena sp. UHCC 0399]MEA5564774.1 adenylate/guanylate cyclase domain-containing protein [Anabaena sp. UHCC 0399]
MKFWVFRSIRTRIMATTTLLLLTVIGAIVSVWAKSESHLYQQESVQDANSFASVLTYTLGDELVEENWSQIRLTLDVLLQQNQDFVYVFISDARQANLIVAASLNELQNQYIPDVVPVAVTNTALESTQPLTVTETFILRDIYFSENLRAKRGERVMEVASDIRLSSGQKIGTLRLGMSLRRVDRAITEVVNQALVVGLIGLAIGWVLAYILAKRISEPIRRLQVSAMKIAAGDWQHRAQITNADEIGALATSFNEMSAALQGSFNKLQKTLESFELFVPNKFILAIAPQGIENIAVGLATTRTITILFCDIRGYTSMSEVMTPQEIFIFLNDYLACMGKAIDQAGGFIDKYIGDAIMALFDDVATDGALQAAIWMQQALDKFNDGRRQNGLPKIAVGIGIHRGEVVMGTVGFTCRIDSTVVGDAVNIAARVEELTKHYGCGILITESVVKNLSSPELFSLRLVNQAVKLKGKDEAIAIYEC